VTENILIVSRPFAVCGPILLSLYQLPQVSRPLFGREPGFGRIFCERFCRDEQSGNILILPMRSFFAVLALAAAVFAQTTPKRIPPDEAAKHLINKLRWRIPHWPSRRASKVMSSSKSASTNPERRRLADSSPVIRCWLPPQSKAQTGGNTSRSKSTGNRRRLSLW